MAARRPRSSRCCNSGSSALARRSSRPVCASSLRSHAAAGKDSAPSSNTCRLLGGITGRGTTDGSLLERVARSPRPLAARDRRDRLDWGVVLLHRARQPPAASRGRGRQRAWRRRRGLGDPRRRPLPGAEVPGRAAAWLVYDALCRLIPNDLALAAVLLVLVTVAAWGVSHLFSGRAEYIQIGAMLGTMMAGNVVFV